MSDAGRLVQKLWSYCNVLRDDGLSYLEYIEQLTYLLLLKMAEERSQILGEAQAIPEGYRWSDLSNPQIEGERLEAHYRETLRELGKQKGLLGLIFMKAQPRIQDPAKLRQLIVELIGKETWTAMSSDVKGDAYEGLLEKNAQDVKGGAGQYFTPRPLIAAIVDCIQPKAGEEMIDPACGTGGFLLAAYDYIASHEELDRDAKRHLKYHALRGVDIVESVTRLCAMNLYLHGIGPDDDEVEPPLKTDDSLRNQPTHHYQVVMTNPPFGKKSSITVVNEEGDEDRQILTYNRAYFCTTTSNKQVNFLQHVKSLLKMHGRAAIVVPDNVLFEGGAGETIRRKLLHECDVHTLLRLPTGIFYAQGVKANVLFFDRKPASETPRRKVLWVYDFRTNEHFPLRTNRLRRDDLDDFVACYMPGERHNRKATWSEENSEGQWRGAGHAELVCPGQAGPGLFSLRADRPPGSARLPAPPELARGGARDRRSALGQTHGLLVEP